jgi:hypothetical protein
MIYLKNKKGALEVDRTRSAYLRNFSEALLNWERNRQEERFAFNRFNADDRKKAA